MKNLILVFTIICIVLAANETSFSQNSFDLTINDFGLYVGNAPRARGLRINWSDSNLDRISGINLTLWKPKKNPGGIVQGISVGLLTPSADVLKGINIGGLGVSADSELSGLNIGLVGVGSGGDISGISIGLIGLGSERDVKGIALGGIGAGAGRDFRGIAFGGVGIGAGRSTKGILIGLVGAGAGENMTGIQVGGVGVGAGNDIKGISIGGIGVGAGNDISGLSFGLVGVGAGRDIKGITIGGFGVASERDIIGLTFSAGRIKVNRIGELRGLSFSSYNQIKGRQTGLAIGIVNYAYDLRGVQLGILNVVSTNPGWRKILPIINWNFD